MRTAVHYGGQMHAMPVDGGSFIEFIMNPHAHGVALVKNQRWPPEFAVNTTSNGLLARLDLCHRVFDGEIEVWTCQRIRNPEIVELGC